MDAETSVSINLLPFKEALDAGALALLTQTVTRPLVPAIRINTLKVAVEKAAAVWPRRYGWQIEPVPFCPTGWRVPAGGQELARTPEFRMGYYYILDSASMLPAELFEIRPGRELCVLDMAASPGGKTTHLACRMNDQGLLVANDSSSSRIVPLRTNLQDWGTTNVAVTNIPGEEWGQWYLEKFDLVLLDAPCSGQGLRTAERRQARPITIRERADLQALQASLLESGFKALKPGGQLVYSTCTLHPDENEAVLDTLLNRYPDCAEILPVGQVQAPALAEFAGRTFHPQVTNALRLWPHLYDTAGFFAALIGKRDSLLSGASPHPSAGTQSVPVHSLRERGFSPLDSAAAAELAGCLGNMYGFNLEALLQGSHLVLLRQRQNIFAIPEPFLLQWSSLPAVTAGMMIAERTESGLIPSHEFVARFGAGFTSGRLAILASRGESWLQGQELRGAPHTFGRGAIVLVEDEWGRLLGRGKVAGPRIRNLLPRRLIY